MGSMATTIVSARPAALDRPLRRRRRFLRTFLFFLGIIIHVFFFDILGNRTPLTRWYAQRSALRRWAKAARDFRALAVAQGGVLIKLGQFLSSRADILPASITDELAGLQDEVPPAPWNVMRHRLARELGRPPEDVFASFDTQAVAAASIGQVYFAQLHDGRAAAVKLQRPQIAEIIDVDLSAVSAAVQIIKNYPLIKRRADLPALFQEFARVLRQELDYELEAENAIQFRANFAEVAGVYVPEPYREHSTKQLLVMERISGVKIHDYAALEAAGIDRAELAERFNKAYQKQFFLDGLFHADPHPGNLFVRPEAPPAPGVATPYTLIFIDLGMVGRITPALMRALREGIIGVATNDAAKMVEALDMGGIIRPGADRGQIVRAIQIVLRHTYDRSIRELTNMDVENVFADVEHLVRDLPFQLPQDLIYLGRAVALVSGITTGLYPDVNLFALTRPFAQELIARQQRELNLAERVRQELGALGQAALALPKEMDAYYKAANRGELQMRVDFGRLERGMFGLERAVASLSAGVVSAGLFVGGAVLRVHGFAADAWWAWGAAALVALWAVRPRRPGR
ncbi:AarF/ABC1/UbiB kinase family protein [Chloroflexia bacterium SDU3-3]|nr:AarF/ABC1/UbiB kinase family protein [Chloroflexia bacterium SDU3-3]